MRYWVVGGEYRDMTFREIVAGKAEERIGPFGNYADAHVAWATRAWGTVDDALMRFRIIGVQSEAA